MSLSSKETSGPKYEVDFPVLFSEKLPDRVDLNNMLNQAARWFTLELANGDARPDTIRTYLSHLKHWLNWCHQNGLAPGDARPEHIRLFRHMLVQKGSAQSTISLKLTTIRRFYDGAVSNSLLKSNPADGIKAPRKRTADEEKVLHLTQGEAERLLEAIPEDRGLKSLRDKAILCLMMLEGLRRVEICRANLSDIEETPSGIRLLVHGKGQDGYIYPREDTSYFLMQYLAMRGDVAADADGEPMFVSLSKGAKVRGRISRIGVSKWLDSLMRKANIPKKGRGCHALRHTCGTLLYQATRDVKVVQETLRHASIAMAARYSHIHNRGLARHTQQIPL